MKVSIAPVLAAAVAATAALLLTFAVPTAGADPSPTDDPACSAGDPLLAVDAGCIETGSEFDAAEGSRGRLPRLRSGRRACRPSATCTWSPCSGR
jgi:hypothetical protein